MDEEVLELGHSARDPIGGKADHCVTRIDRDPHPPLVDAMLSDHQRFRMPEQRIPVTLVGQRGPAEDVLQAVLV